MGRTVVIQSMMLQQVGHDLMTEKKKLIFYPCLSLLSLSMLILLESENILGLPDFNP